MSNIKTTPAESLVGHYFHSISKTGKVQWQGIVVGNPEPGWYVLQLFEWLVGEQSVRRLAHLQDMRDWLFYKDREAMLYSYEYGTARAGGPYRDEV